MLDLFNFLDEGRRFEVLRPGAAILRGYALDQERAIVDAFGRGEYKYFAYPLPGVIFELRAEIYPHLSPVANRWNEAMGIDVRYPHDLAEFLKRCHDADAPGDFNCLHQDLYGEHVFPLQVAILLSGPDDDFTGGEFVLTEKRPRMQSKVAVVPLRRAMRISPNVSGIRGPCAPSPRPAPQTRSLWRFLAIAWSGMTGLSPDIAGVSNGNVLYSTERPSHEWRVDPGIV